MRKKGLHTGDLRFLPEGKGFLLVEFGGETREESDEAARRMMRHLHWSLRPPSMKLYDDMAEEKLVWEIRGIRSTRRNRPEFPENPILGKAGKMRPFLQKNWVAICAICGVCSKNTEYGCALYGHFGQGCVIPASILI